MDRGAWQATVHGVPRVEHKLATKPLPPILLITWYSVSFHPSFCFLNSTPRPVGVHKAPEKSTDSDLDCLVEEAKTGMKTD